MKIKFAMLLLMIFTGLYAEIIGPDENEFDPYVLQVHEQCWNLYETHKLHIELIEVPADYFTSFLNICMKYVLANGTEGFEEHIKNFNNKVTGCCYVQNVPYGEAMTVYTRLGTHSENDTISGLKCQEIITKAKNESLGTFHKIYKFAYDTSCKNAFPTQIKNNKDYILLPLNENPDDENRHQLTINKTHQESIRKVNRNSALYNDISVQYQRLKYILHDNEAVTFQNEMDKWEKYDIIENEQIDDYLAFKVPVMHADLKQEEHLQSIVNSYGEQDKIDIISMDRFTNDTQTSTTTIFNKLEKSTQTGFWVHKPYGGKSDGWATKLALDHINPNKYQKFKGLFNFWREHDIKDRKKQPNNVYISFEDASYSGDTLIDNFRYFDIDIMVVPFILDKTIRKFSWNKWFDWQIISLDEFEKLDTINTTSQRYIVHINPIYKYEIEDKLFLFEFKIADFAGIYTGNRGNNAIDTIKKSCVLRPPYKTYTTHVGSNSPPWSDTVSVIVDRITPPIIERILIKPKFTMIYDFDETLSVYDVGEPVRRKENTHKPDGHSIEYSEVEEWFGKYRIWSLKYHFQQLKSKDVDIRILSLNMSTVIDKVLTLLDLRQYVTEIIGMDSELFKLSNNGGNVKANVINHWMKEYNLKPQDVYFVDDNRTHIAYANRDCKCKTKLVRQGINREQMREFENYFDEQSIQTWKQLNNIN
jgi:hypothetical protein